MKPIVSAIAAALAVAIPFTVLAQPTPAPGAPPAGGPPPAAWSEMQKARDDTRAAAFDDLTPEHRAQVQSIVDRVNAGTLTDLGDASRQIDAVLTPDESKAVLAERAKMRDAMRAQMAQNGGPPGGGRWSGRNGRMRSGRAGARSNDAGAFLLDLAVTPDRMRALREQMRDGEPARPPAG